MNPEKIIYLAEFGDSIDLPWTSTKIAELEAMLEEVWENRKRSGILSEWYEAEEEPINQPLLEIKRKRVGTKSMKFSIRAGNYVGIIRFKETTIHILPKLFKDSRDEIGLRSSNAHLLWWLSYSNKMALPKHVTSLAYQKCDFMEILIHLFATYTADQLQKGIYQTYQEIESETNYLKGQLVFNEYISNYLGRANYQKLYCRYDSFEMDNLFNRIIKRVCIQLRRQTSVRQTRSTLDYIIGTLSEVSDVAVTREHCDQVLLNKMFSEYQMVLDYCRMFLSNSQTTSSSVVSDSFAFLVPMEKVFEDFILGFINKEVEEIQASSKYQKITLTEGGRVRLNPDLHLENVITKAKFLADTKYKLVYDQFTGVSHSDLYQMSAYAIRYRTDQIHLFYPKWNGINIDRTLNQIRDEWAAENTFINIHLHALEVLASLEGYAPSTDIKKLFETTKDNLINQLRNVLAQKK